jgi:hypothetical protein
MGLVEMKGKEVKNNFEVFSLGTMVVALTVVWVLGGETMR